MSSRKRTKPGSPSPTGNDRDEESLHRHKPEYAITRSRTKSSRSQLKATIHKIICIISPYASGSGGITDEQDSGGGIKGLLQDIVCGIALGALGMCFILLLDYSNIINLETARVFRKTASDIFNINTSPDILLIESMKDEFQNNEDMRNTELVPMAVYNSMKKELSDSKSVMDSEERIVTVRSKKAALFKEEISLVKVEYGKLYKQLGLEVFCPTCHWGMGMTCKQRVNYMLENYSDTATTIGCIAKLVEQGKKNGKCLTPPPKK